MNELRRPDQAGARPIFALALLAAAFGIGFASGGYGGPADRGLVEASGTCPACEQGLQEEGTALPGGEVTCLSRREDCGLTLSSGTGEFQRLAQENIQLRRQVAEISLENSILRSEADDYR